MLEQWAAFLSLKSELFSECPCEHSLFNAKPELSDDHM
jgi:hypothetical protein